MRVIIVGCGRLGQELAYQLEERGDRITAIDNNPEVLASMRSYFKGTQVAGGGFEREVLEQAGIRLADAVIASTASDETNALIARLARNIYHVPKVIARLYDVRKAAIYNALGIQTLSTTAWGVQRTKEMLSFQQLDTVMEIGNDEVQVVRVEAPSTFAGTTISDFARLGEISVMAVTRGNATFMPVYGTSIAEGDILHIAVLSASLPQLKRALDL